MVRLRIFFEMNLISKLTVALVEFDTETESAIGQRHVLMTKAVGEAWEQVSY